MSISQDRPRTRVDGNHLADEGPTSRSWLEEYYQSLPMQPFGEKPPIEDYCDAYRFGVSSRKQNSKPYPEVYHILKESWDDLIGTSVLDWEQAEPIIRYAYTQDSVKQSRRLHFLQQTAA